MFHVPGFIDGLSALLKNEKNSNFIFDPTVLEAVDKTRNMEHSGTSRNTKKKINKNKGKMKKNKSVYIYIK